MAKFSTDMGMNNFLKTSQGKAFTAKYGTNRRGVLPVQPVQFARDSDDNPEVTDSPPRRGNYSILLPSDNSWNWANNFDLGVLRHLTSKQLDTAPSSLLEKFNNEFFLQSPEYESLISRLSPDRIRGLGQWSGTGFANDIIKKVLGIDAPDIAPPKEVDVAPPKEGGDKDIIGTGSGNMANTGSPLAAPPFADAVGRLFGKSLTPQDIAGYFDFKDDPMAAAWNLLRAAGGSSANPYVQKMALRIAQQAQNRALSDISGVGNADALSSSDFINSIFGGGTPITPTSGAIEGLLGNLNSLLRQYTDPNQGGAGLSAAQKTLGDMLKTQSGDVWSSLVGQTVPGFLRKYVEPAAQSASDYYSDVLAPQGLGMNLLDFLTNSMGIPRTTSMQALLGASPQTNSAAKSAILPGVLPGAVTNKDILQAAQWLQPSRLRGNTLY